MFGCCDVSGSSIAKITSGAPRSPASCSTFARKKLIADFPTRIVNRANKFDTVERYQHGINLLNRELELDATITLKTIVNAKKSFDEKVDRLVRTLVQEGFGHAHYKVELIKDRGSKLEFIISKSDKTVHARLIWVDGVLVEPHFRFITTTRKTN